MWAIEGLEGWLGGVLRPLVEDSHHVTPEAPNKKEEEKQTFPSVHFIFHGLFHLIPHYRVIIYPKP